MEILEFKLESGWFDTSANSIEQPRLADSPGTSLQPCPFYLRSPRCVLGDVFRIDNIVATGAA